MDSGTSMVKYILFIFNTLVSIIGILGIMQGVFILKTMQTVDSNGVRWETLMPIILIALGSVVVIISFLGCCGAIRESVCMTMTYAFFMLVLLILQIVIVVLLYTHKAEFQEAMGKVIDRALERDAREAGVFDAIQKLLHCCGKVGSKDYLQIGGLPNSCCVDPPCSHIYSTYSGCRIKFQNFMSASTDTSKYIGMGLMVVELVGFIFACSLANNIRNYKRRNEY